MAAELSLSKLSFRLLKSKRQRKKKKKKDFLRHCCPLGDIRYPWVDSLRPLLTLPLAADGRQCRFGVKLQPLSQGLPDLLRVCRTQHEQHRERVPSRAAYGFLVLGTGTALLAPVRCDVPFSESLLGCDPMQIDRLSSSSSGGRLRSSHTHLALTPLRLEPSVSIPWSTLSCLDEQEVDMQSSTLAPARIRPSVNDSKFNTSTPIFVVFL